MSIHAPWNDRLAEPLARDHMVQLYRDERFLVEAVALFAGRGLGKGEAVVLVATAAHLAAVEDRLRRDGFDLEDLKAWGQLAVLDASDLLSCFMRDSWPDRALFTAAVTEVIGAARRRKYRKVRVYGEMVNLLWRDNLPAARRLEELWNEVIQAHAVSLFCAYHLDRGHEEEGPFPSDLRALHSHLIPIEACA